VRLRFAGAPRIAILMWTLGPATPPPDSLLADFICLDAVFMTDIDFPGDVAGQEPIGHSSQSRPGYFLAVPNRRSHAEAR
jgi:hypothetical protein